MIEKLSTNSVYLDELEKCFPHVITKKSIQKDMEENIFTTYLAYVIEERCVAFINYYKMYGRCELINIHVLEEYQNQKIASHLLEYMIEDCVQNKIESITLEVKKTNEKAIHLYHKYGFKDIGVREKYYHGVDGILMEKELM